MTADEMRAALTAVLAEVPELDAEFVADRILPTVRGIVAGELREMADVFDADARHLDGGANYAQAAEDCRDQAAALDPAS